MNKTTAIPVLIQHTLFVEASVRANHEGIDVEKYINDMLDKLLSTEMRTYHTKEEGMLLEAGAAYEKAKVGGAHELAIWGERFPMFEFRSDVECVAYKDV